MNKIASPHSLKIKKKEILAKAGSSIAVAHLLGISPAAISRWKTFIPAARVWQLRVLKPQWFKD